MSDKQINELTRFRLQQARETLANARAFLDAVESYLRANIYPVLEGKK